MKAKIIEKEKKFEPIKIELTIESEEELCDLWHRANVGHIGLGKLCDDSLPYMPTENGCLSLFNILEKATYDFNLRK